MKTLIIMLVALAGLVPAISASCPDCVTYAETTSKGKINPLSVPDDTENCDSLRFNVMTYISEQDWQQAYDTVQKFIETCYNDPNAPLMFQDFSAALQPLATADSSLWQQARQWLESVLYLNTTNPEYFCACVKAIIGTFNSPSDNYDFHFHAILNY